MTITELDRFIKFIYFPRVFRNKLSAAATLKCITAEHIMPCCGAATSGEFGICIWDERCPLSRVDADEWWRSQVPHTQHGQPWLRGGACCLLCCWNHLWIETSTCREHCVQVDNEFLYCCCDVLFCSTANDISVGHLQITSQYCTLLHILASVIM